MATIGIKLRVFVPREVMNLPGVERGIEHTMLQKTAPELRKEFEKTVRSWDDKPVFKTEHYFGARVRWVKVYTNYITYRLVNAGAKPHIIRPRRGGMLRFRTGFKAKTRPRLIGSFPGGKFGDYISTNVVHHPGFEAREFDMEIAEQYAETFQNDIQEAIKDGILHK